MVMQPIQQLMVPVGGDATYAPKEGGVEVTPAFERRNAHLVSLALVTMTEGKT